MEPLGDSRMYFPAAPVSDPADYLSLPRRRHVYLGERLEVVLVLRSSGWQEAASLLALPSVSVAETQGRGAPEGDQASGDSGGEQPAEEQPGADTQRGFSRLCCPLLNHSHSASARSGAPVKPALVLDDQVIFCLTVSLDKLPVNTLKAKIVVTVWKREEDKAEVQEHGYLTLLHLKSPAETFRQDLSSFKSQVSAVLNVLPPPSVQCQQMMVCGKHMTVLKVVNSSSREEVCVRDVKILPNYNSSFLPMMPDGSVLIVDPVCHRSAEVTTASFCRLDSQSSRLPSMLSALEEHNFLFQLQLQETQEEDSSEGLEVPLVALVQWCTPTLSSTRWISSCYSLPGVRLERPRLVMTASCPGAVQPQQNFRVRYTLLNNLQDFLSVRLVWNSEGGAGGRDPGGQDPGGRDPGGRDPGLGAVLCRSPLNHLGRCRKGSTLSFTVAFQILRTGLFELSQNMKLKLQFTASVSPPAGDSVSPGSMLELLQRRGHGRSLSFSHQQPSRSSHVRSGSTVTEAQAVTPPPPPPPRAMAPPPEHALIALGKIAKRECKVLVLEPVQEALSR